MEYQLNNSTEGIGRRIYELLRSRIERGALSPGEPLPSTRALAADQGVSRTTVVTIYEQLAAEGYIETAPGKRARVYPGLGPRDRPPRPRRTQRPDHARELSAYAMRLMSLDVPMRPTTDPQRINFLYGGLADEDFPKLAWRRLYNRALTRRQHPLYYGTTAGEADLRTELQGYLLRARGLSCTPDQILIVQGSQQAIDLCARLLINPGDRVAIEEPCYLMARRSFESVGAQVVGTPVDDQGLISAALPPSRTALTYVTPSHQFPLGAVMSIGRRKALLDWAMTHSSWVIEDDYDSEFRYGLRPVDPLQSLDTQGCVIYIGTFSKALSPQLRLGYLVLPPALVKPFLHARQLADRHSPVIEQSVLAELIRSGAYERHLRRLRRENERRRAALVESLAKHLGTDARVEGTESGLHGVVWIPGLPIRAEPAIVAEAFRAGVGVRAITPLYAEGIAFRNSRCAGLVLGYASLTATEIEEGVYRLARALRAVAAQVRRPDRRRGRSTSL
jgi:GntR family transcriptional regulator/MocR family aminotransferase